MDGGQPVEAGGLQTGCRIRRCARQSRLVARRPPRRSRGSNSMVLRESGYLLVLCSVVAVSLFCWLSYSCFLDRHRKK